jgi:hypothetical protein
MLRHRFVLPAGRPAAGGDRAGQLRAQPVFYDEREHLRLGIAPQRIRDELTRLFDDMVRGAHLVDVVDKDQFSRWGARLLRRWFWIHPFDDGNGRIGRAFLARCALDAGPWQMDYSGLSGADDYLSALRHAHKHHPDERRASGAWRAPRDTDGELIEWSVPLANWILGRMVDIEPLESAPPPPPTRDRGA